MAWYFSTRVSVATVVSMYPSHDEASSNGDIFHVTGHFCGNSPVTGEFPTQRPVMRSFDVFFGPYLNKWFEKMVKLMIWDAIRPIMTSLQCISSCWWVNTLRLRENGYQCVWISIKISLKFTPNGMAPSKQQAVIRIDVGPDLRHSVALLGPMS